MSTPAPEPPAEVQGPDPLGLSVAHFAAPQGPDLLARTSDLYEWTTARRRADVAPYFRALDSAPEPTARMREESGRSIQGINFASQDYLGLAGHHAVREAAIAAVRDFGTHSAGSGLLQGGTSVALELEKELAEFVHAREVALFPTGWAAGFGTIVALVRPYDHIVMDNLSHASLQQGAMAATPQVRRHRHLDADDARDQLRAIRANDSNGGILVITEGLFSMDADTPQLAPLVEACREHEATLLVDAAHDLGQLGPGGTGQLGIQSVLGEVDLVMGAFSKTFASNGGFLAVHESSVKDFVRLLGGPFTFSNALSAVHAAAALEAVRITRSSEGDALRASLQDAVGALRATLANAGIECLGMPCAIVAVPIGRDAVGRIAASLLRDRGVLANLVEFPGVSLDRCRFRMQVQATHTVEQAREAGRIVAECIQEATERVGAPE